MPGHFKTFLFVCRRPPEIANKTIFLLVFLFSLHYMLLYFATYHKKEALEPLLINYFPSFLCALNIVHWKEAFGEPPPLSWVCIRGRSRSDRVSI